MPSVKIERLQQLIKEKISRVIQQDISDPRMGILTLTDIKLSRDLSKCTVLYSVLGSDAVRSRTAFALEDSRGFIQREVAGALKTRTTPHLDFKFDPSIEGSVRVSQLIKDSLEDVQDPAGDSNANPEGDGEPDGDD